MTDGLGLRAGTLALAPHDPRWIAAFDLLRAALAGGWDRLRASPELRAAYAAEKRRIIDAGTARTAYAEAKTPFIKAALA